LRPHSNPIPEEFVSDSPRDADPSFSLTRRPEKARVENPNQFTLATQPSQCNPTFNTMFLLQQQQQQKKKISAQNTQSIPIVQHPKLRKNTLQPANKIWTHC
jgi:hypothetical protein